MDINEKSLKMHYEWKGKLRVTSDIKLENNEDLSLAYTPGVAKPCLEIQRDIKLSYDLTGRQNSIAVITDGTAVLGLGDIGPEAGMPVMEGKCLLFNKLAGIDATPICIRSKDVDEIVRTVYLISGSFGGINLEDISAPRCFEIEKRLKQICDIPVFHDDQHGTAIITNAALTNALKLVGKPRDKVKIVINGAGSAGVSIGRLILSSGAKNVVFVDKTGALTKENTNDNPIWGALAPANINNEEGSLCDVIKDADVFIGVSRPGLLTEDMVRTMAKDPIVFAMANPTPEIMPHLAKRAGAAIVGTGRSDFPNQINNALAFPGVYRGALDCRASDITEGMELAASRALAEIILEDELDPEYIIPSVFDKRVCPTIAEAVAEEARKEGIARI